MESSCDENQSNCIIYKGWLGCRQYCMCSVLRVKQEFSSSDVNTIGSYIYYYCIIYFRRNEFLRRSRINHFRVGVNSRILLFLEGEAIVLHFTGVLISRFNHIKKYAAKIKPARIAMILQLFTWQQSDKFYSKAIACHTRYLLICRCWRFVWLRTLQTWGNYRTCLSLFHTKTRNILMHSIKSAREIISTHMQSDET